MSGWFVNRPCGAVGRVLRAAALAGAAFASVGTATAQALPELPIAGVEPVLGLRFPTGRVQFETLPAAVLAGCAGLSGPGARVAWDLADVSAGGRRYVVLGGFVAGGEAGAGLEPDARGAVLDIGPDGCRVLGPARAVFDQRPEALPQPVLEQLAADLARRYAGAFGSVDGLHAAIRRQRLIPPPSSPVLRAALGVEERAMPAR
ncbi:hypothetical protein [Azohydromonas aeria]|uniref:hypothetical protein n=1 Tax=Azohydromonas aeria TaxID=2590212 RepID=UPI0012F961AD|nr:hypothetical protein [Azohydromonas aeria]